MWVLPAISAAASSNLLEGLQPEAAAAGVGNSTCMCWLLCGLLLLLLQVLSGCSAEAAPAITQGCCQHTCSHDC
jgi:hypothetical protein